MPDPNIPGIPTSLPPDLAQFFTAVKACIEILMGQGRNTEADRALRVRELNATTVSNLVEQSTSTSGVSQDTPVAPTGLIISKGAFSHHLSWTNPTDEIVSHVEVWVAEESQSRNNAVLIGIVTVTKNLRGGAGRFINSGFDPTHDFAYWIRSVSYADIHSGWCPPDEQGGYAVSGDESFGVTIDTIIDVLKGGTPALYVPAKDYSKDERCRTADGRTWVSIYEGAHQGHEPPNATYWDRDGILMTGDVDGTPTVGIDGNLVVDDTVLARHIQAEQIKAAHIDVNELFVGMQLQSSNYILNQTGWKLESTGDARFNSSLIVNSGDSLSMSDKGLFVGDISSLTGWVMNKVGLGSFLNGLALHGFNTGAGIVPWQTGTAGNITTLNPNFVLNPGDIVLGGYNYKWISTGEALGGVKFDQTTGRVLVRGAIVEESEIDYNNIDNGPPSNADNTASNQQSWAWISGTKPDQNADVSGTAFATQTWNKTGGSLSFAAGVDLKLKSVTGDYASLEFANDANANVSGIWFDRSTQTMQVSPINHGGASNLQLGMNSTFDWNNINIWCNSFKINGSAIGGTTTLVGLGVNATAAEINTVADGPTAKNSHGHAWSEISLPPYINRGVNYTEATATIKPNVNNSHGLGASGLQWHSIYGAYIYQNGVRVSNVGHTHSGYCGSSDYRLSNARTPTAHNQAWSTITSKPYLEPGIGCSTASASIRPNNSNQHGLGTTGQYWASIHASVLNYKTFASFDNLDDLAAVDQFAPAIDEDGKIKMVNGVQHLDVKKVPAVFTNRQEVMEVLHCKFGVDLTSQEIQEILDGTKVSDKITSDQIEDLTFMDAGKVMALLVGATKQLNKEVTEDVVEELNHIIEGLIERITKLEMVA
ncbi:MAG: hypothetical protein JEZ12_15970 [Desulfobacterium sp.]|nr:hypothetical protein [Desulfobacterium sp.]